MTPETDDQQIVAAVLCGDVNAFEIIVRRYYAAMRRMAISKTGLIDEADDIVQDSFTAAYRSLHTYKRAFSFRTWLWTILINQCRQTGRRATKRPRQWTAPDDIDGRPMESGAVLCKDELPDQTLELREREQYLRRLLLQLPETRGDAVRLRFFGQLKYTEIADAMQCSLSAAKKWVREGLLMMSDQIREDPQGIDNVDIVAAVRVDRTDKKQ